MMNSIAGYPETVFSAANFFGPTPPPQQGNGPQLLNQSQNAAPQPKMNMHVIGVVAVFIIGGYLLWHFSYEK